MIKVLIVDDEKWVRLGLRKQADWTGLGLEIIDDAENGDRALKIINENLPDIIVTDIRMPVMNGIQLMEAVRLQHPRMVFIVLSGYSDFEYAKKAIGLNAIGYIVKPVEEIELETTLKKAVEIVREQRKNDKDLEAFEKQREENISFQRDRLLTNYFMGIGNKTEWIDRLFLECGLIPSYKNFRVITATVNNFLYIAKEQFDFDYEYLSTVLLNTVKLVTKNRPDIFIVKNINREGEIFIVMGFTMEEIDSGEKSRQLSEEILIGLKAGPGLSAAIGIGGEYEGISGISKSYKDAVEAMGCGQLFKIGGIISSSDIRSRPVEYLQDEKISSMLQHLELGNKELCIKAMEEFFKYVIAKKPIGIDILRRILTEILIKMDTVVRKSGFSIDELVGCENVYDHVMNRNTNLQDLKDLYINLINSIVDFGHEEKKGGFIKKLPDILEYINRYYSQGINLESVAAYFFVTPAYLSRVFKNETGQNFSKYLTDIRMKKAAELLVQNKEVKLIDIAAILGFENPEYFLKKFKQYYRCTPTEYKEKQKIAAKQE